MTLQTLPRSTPTSQILEVLKEEGALIVEDFLDQNTLAAFNREIDTELNAQQPDRRFMSDIYDHFFGQRTRHLTAIAGRSPVFRDQILLHDLYHELCDDILLPNCAHYQLNYSHIFEICPGGRRQPLHRDGLCWPQLQELPYEIEVASILALTEFTAENGATLVVPGSHRWSMGRELRYEDAVPAVMKAGSALLYLGRTAHAAGANTTSGDWRRGMHVSFCLGWLRTEENNYIATPLQQVRDFSPEVQQLLGYRAHDAAPLGGCLGVYNMLDPVTLMAQGRI